MKTESMVGDGMVGSGGYVSFWTIRLMDLLKLTRDWPEELGDFLPAKRTPVAALKAALDRAFREGRTLVRPLAEEGHYAVVEEKVQPEGLPTYETVFACKASIDDVGFEALPGFEYCSASRAAVGDALVVTKNELPPMAVTKALTAVVEKLHGVSLREAGGVYYVPPAGVQLWKRVAAAVEGATAVEGNGSSVYMLSTELTPESIRAVREALASEVEAEVARLQAGLELTGDEALGVRGLNHRSRALAALAEKVGSYEKTLAESLSVLTETITRAEAATAAAKCALEAEEAAEEAA